MTAALALLAAVGVLLVVTGQPLGRARPTLAQRLAALRPTRPDPAPPQPQGWARAALAGAVAAAGALTVSVATRIGLRGHTRARQLTALGEVGGVTVHYGQQAILALLGVSVVPLFAALGMPGLATWPVWTWLAAAVGLASLPPLRLRLRWVRTRRTLAGQAALACEYLALAVAAGLGLEQALAETAKASDTALFVQLRTRLAHARLAGLPASHAVASLAVDYQLPELDTLAGVMAASARYGTALGGALRAHADAIRERRRLAVLAAGEQAQLLLLLPIAGLILPAFLLVLGYPFAVALLTFTTP